MKYLSLVAAVLLCGCVSVGRKIDQSQVDQLKEGQSKEEVRALIGSPDNVTRESSGDEVWTYSYIHSQVKGATFIPIVGAFAGGSDTQQQSVVVTFGSDGRMAKYSTSFGGQEVTSDAAAGGKAKLSTDANKRPK